MFLLGSAVCVVGASSATADRIENGVAVFSALDKVTARISKLDAHLDQTVRFGSLKVTPRVCYSRPPTEAPKTTAFVEVDEVQLDGQEKRLFAGWMFAESPGLNAVEHPVFDVWLTQCNEPASGSGSAGGNAAGQPPPAATDPLEPRRRVRR